MPQDPYLKVSKKQQNHLLQKFSMHPHPWIIFGIGAIEAFKSWPIESFADLAQELTKKGEKTIFLCCSSTEQERAHAILSLLKTTDTSIIPIIHFSLDEVLNNFFSFLNFLAKLLQSTKQHLRKTNGFI